VGPIKLSYTGSIFGLFLELLTDLTVQTAFVEMGSRAAFRITLRRRGLMTRSSPVSPSSDHNRYSDKGDQISGQPTYQAMTRAVTLTFSRLATI